LLLDGIFVAEDTRGMGVGTQLLTAIKDFAVIEEYKEIRLDVINTNPRAKALYEREGFAPVGEVKAGMLSGVLGFSKATTMVFSVPSQRSQ
jgi:ribosomal protein S18 acetylase RimI-like enzyme